MGALDRSMHAAFRDPAKLKRVTTLLDSGIVHWQWPITLQMMGSPMQWAGALKRFQETQETQCLIK